MGVHLFGAFLTFFVGLAYFWLQLYLTYRARPSRGGCCIGPIRAICCALCTILVIFSILPICVIQRRYTQYSRRVVPKLFASHLESKCEMYSIWYGPLNCLQPQTRTRNYIQNHMFPTCFHVLFDLLSRAFIWCCAPWLLSPPTVAVLHNVGYRSAAAVCEWALVMVFFCLFGLFAAEFRHIDFHRLTVQKQGLKSDRPTSIEINGHAANALRWTCTHEHTGDTLSLGMWAKQTSEMWVFCPSWFNNFLFIFFGTCSVEFGCSTQPRTSFNCL